MPRRSEVYVCVAHPVGRKLEEPVFRCGIVERDVVGLLRRATDMVVLKVNAAGNVFLRAVLVRTHAEGIVLVLVACDGGCRRGSQRRENLVAHAKLDATVLSVHSAHGIVHERVELIVIEAGAFDAVPHLSDESADASAETVVVPDIGNVGRKETLGF